MHSSFCQGDAWLEAYQLGKGSEVGEGAFLVNKCTYFLNKFFCIDRIIRHLGCGKLVEVGVGEVMLCELLTSFL